MTGAAGFIGSHLVDALLGKGYEVVGYDNLSTGHMEFLKGALSNSRFFLHVANVNDGEGLFQALEGCDFVFHMAATADVRNSLEQASLHRDAITATSVLLEQMRKTGVRKIAFASTGSVYGEPSMIPTPELAPMPVQTSLYAASKVAGEGMISAMAEGGQLDEAYIFRFVSILGERYTHGHVFDFYRQLVEHPDQLDVLGNGTQRKSYLYVQDCISAMLEAIELEYASTQRHRTAVLNLGTREFVDVKESIRIICEELDVAPRIEYGDSPRGWPGDTPFLWLETSRMRALGWRPLVSVPEAIRKTVGWLKANEWVFEKHGGKPLQRPEIWCAACGKWGKHGSATCPTIAHLLSAKAS